MSAPAELPVCLMTALSSRVRTWEWDGLAVDTKQLFEGLHRYLLSTGRVVILVVEKADQQSVDVCHVARWFSAEEDGIEQRHELLQVDLRQSDHDVRRHRVVRQQPAADRLTIHRHLDRHRSFGVNWIFSTSLESLQQNRYYIITIMRESYAQTTCIALQRNDNGLQISVPILTLYNEVYSS